MAAMDRNQRRASARRDVTATRAAILGAARDCFAAKGFDGTGMRDIAGGAGVNLALINRYFGSKEALFVAAVVPTLRINLLLDGSMDAFGRRAATLMVMKSANGYDPMMALLRATGHPECSKALRTALDEQVIAPLAARLRGSHRRVRAGLIMAMLAGFDVVMRAPGSDLMAASDRSLLTDELATAVQALVDRGN